MPSHKAADSPDSLDLSTTHDSDEGSTLDASSDQTDRSDKDVMCLVYPDGSLITIELEPDSD